MPQNCVNVAVAAPVDGVFTYRLPSALVPQARIGKRVLVPFGRRRLTGYIVAFADKTDVPKLKTVLDILDETPLFSASLLPFFQWTADYYLYPLGLVIKAALPTGINTGDEAVFSLSSKGQAELAKPRLAPVSRQLLETLSEGPLSQTRLLRRFDNAVSSVLVNRLTAAGLIEKKRQLKTPAVRPKTERWVALIRPLKPMRSLSAAKMALLQHLEPVEKMAVADLSKIRATATAHIRELEKKGYLRITDRTVVRDPLGAPVTPDTPPVLTVEQRRVVRQMGAILKKGFSVQLLAGVTGSGKTEVYLQLSRRVYDQGKSVLVLVPEIALIAQMAHRFRARFGECVAILHSGLSRGERFDQWRRIAQNQQNRTAMIVVGARSAVFAPLENIGLIVVDEEHDGSYKQESGLRYNGRDLAVVRARQAGCPVLLGSATPSVPATYHAATGKFGLLSLTKRVAERPLPEIRTVDLKKETGRRGIERFFSNTLWQAITDTLARGGQILLFLNRRGYANFAVCGECGEALRCTHCDICLTLHHNQQAYQCHYCGFSLAARAHCPQCLSGNICRLGLGTEKIEEIIGRAYPEARIARMDQDTTRRKGSVVQMLKRLEKGRTDILIGTQMIAKGHDFPGITLVGIICADLSLDFPDFRAAERTFQILAQVAGRAGRGERPGTVILQTFNPGHFAIETARQQDYVAFYKAEIKLRQALAYPPFSRMVQLRVSGKSAAAAEKWAERLGTHCREMIAATDNRIQLLGPVAAAIARIADRYRWQLLLKGPHMGRLRQVVRRALDALDKPPADIKIQVDVEPHAML